MGAPADRLNRVLVALLGLLLLTGGVLGPGPIANAVAARWPGRCLLASDGSSGAALLALREVGLPSGPAVLARIKAGLASARP